MLTADDRAEIRQRWEQTTKGPWRFCLRFIPPGVNHQYVAIGNGKKALTQEAKDLRTLIASAVDGTGFVPRRDASYGVRVVFVMPGWSQDIDSPLKAMLDAVFGARGDHRVVRLEVEKRVVRGVRRTEVEIWECA